MRLLPDAWDADDAYELHWMVKLNSQAFCHATRPDCRACPLAAACRTGGASGVLPS
jgi:endonuclease-3